MSAQFIPYGQDKITNDMSSFDKIYQRLLASIPVWDPSINDEGVQKGAMFVAQKLVGLGISDDNLLNSPMTATRRIVKGIIGSINSDYIELINLTWGKIPRLE